MDGWIGSGHRARCYALQALARKILVSSRGSVSRSDLRTGPGRTMTKVKLMAAAGLLVLAVSGYFLLKYAARAPAPATPGPLLRNDAGGSAAMNRANCARGSFLRKITRPSDAAPCNWNTCFAKSTPTICDEVEIGYPAHATGFVTRAGHLRCDRRPMQMEPSLTPCVR